MGEEIHRSDIDNRFAFHPAIDEETKGRHEGVRESCGDVARRFEAWLPAGREKALAITKLEEAMMWANAAIARER